MAERACACAAGSEQRQDAATRGNPAQASPAPAFSRLTCSCFKVARSHTRRLRSSLQLSSSWPGSRARPVTLASWPAERVRGGEAAAQRLQAATRVCASLTRTAHKHPPVSAVGSRLPPMSRGSPAADAVPACDDAAARATAPGAASAAPGAAAGRRLSRVCNRMLPSSQPHATRCRLSASRHSTLHAATGASSCVCVWVSTGASSLTVAGNHHAQATRTSTPAATAHHEPEDVAVLLRVQLPAAQPPVCRARQEGLVVRAVGRGAHQHALHPVLVPRKHPAYGRRRAAAQRSGRQDLSSWPMGTRLLTWHTHLCAAWGLNCHTMSCRLLVPAMTRSLPGGAHSTVCSCDIWGGGGGRRCRPVMIPGLWRLRPPAQARACACAETAAAAPARTHARTRVRTISWLGCATTSVMTAGARGSSTATRPPRPDAHHTLSCGRCATCTGWLLSPSNLSRHLQAGVVWVGGGERQLRGTMHRLCVGRGTTRSAWLPASNTGKRTHLPSTLHTRSTPSRLPASSMLLVASYARLARPPLPQSRTRLNASQGLSSLSTSYTPMQPSKLRRRLGGCVRAHVRLAGCAGVS
jgi:hypothetical protein